MRIVGPGQEIGSISIYDKGRVMPDKTETVGIKDTSFGILAFPKLPQKNMLPFMNNP